MKLNQNIYKEEISVKSDAKKMKVIKYKKTLLLLEADLGLLQHPKWSAL